MKIIDNCFHRSFLNKVGRVTSNLLEVAQIIDHTTVRGSPKRSMSLGGSRVAVAKQEPAVGGETPSCYGEFRLELPYGDYALAMLVWSQQTAKAEQIFAITNGNNKKRLGARSSLFCWLRMLGSEVKND